MVCPPPAEGALAQPSPHLPLPHPQHHVLLLLGDFAHVFAAGGLNSARTYQLLRLVMLLKMVHNNAPQLLLPLETYAKEKKHPSNGSNPYSDDFRDNIITRFLSNLPLDLPELTIMRQQYAHPCLETCKRYASQFQLSKERDWESQGTEGSERTGSCQPSAVLISVPHCLVGSRKGFHPQYGSNWSPFLADGCMSCRAPSWLMAKSTINNMPAGIPSFE